MPFEQKSVGLFPNYYSGGQVQNRKGNSPFQMLCEPRLHTINLLLQSRDCVAIIGFNASIKVANCLKR